MLTTPPLVFSLGYFLLGSRSRRSLHAQFRDIGLLPSLDALSPARRLALSTVARPSPRTRSTFGTGCGPGGGSENGAFRQPDDPSLMVLSSGTSDLRRDRR